jgi:lauroyl/myristoyl acyltransferase
VVLLALVLGGLLSLATLKFQTDIWPLLPPQLPSVQGLQTAQTLLPISRDVIVVISPNSRLNPTEKEALLSQIAATLSAEPTVESVYRLNTLDSSTLPALTAWIVAQLPPADFNALQAELDPHAMRERLQGTLQRLSGAVDPAEAALLSYDPLRLIEWLSSRGYVVPVLSPPSELSTFALAVRSRAPLPGWTECQAFVQFVRNHLPAEQQRDFLLTGRPAFTAEIAAQMRGDMLAMIAIALLLTSGAFWLFYRSAQPLLWILLAQITAIFGGLIAARICFGELNLLSFGFASILLGVGLDYCILVYHHFARGLDRHTATWRSLHRGIWLSAFTTAGSFAVLAFASFPGLRQLALLVGLGLLVVAWLATDWLPDRLAGRLFPSTDQLQRISTRAGQWLAEHRSLLRRVGWCLPILLFLGLVLFRPSLYESDLQKVQPRELEAYRGQALLPPSSPHFVLLRATTWADLREEAALLQKQGFLTQPVQRLLLPGDEMDLKARAWRPGRSLTFQEVAQQLGLEKTWQENTANWLLRLDLWSENTTPLQLPSPWPDFFSETDEKIALLQVNALLPAQEKVPHLSVLPVDWEILKGELSQIARHDFLQLSLGFFLVIVVLCTWAHRSVFLVGLNLLTLLTALLLFAALLAIFQVRLTVLSLLAIPLLIGLVIDYSLHFILALEEHDGDIAEAYRHIAAPVTLTGLASMIGFGAPMLTRQPILQNFGLVMDLGILSAVSTTLILLPVWYRPGRSALPHYSRALYQAGFFQCGAFLGRYLSRPLLQGMGQGLGWIYGLTRRRTQTALRDNLSLLIQPVSSSRLQRVFVEYGAVFADYFRLGYLTPAQILDLAEDRWGYEHLRAAHEAGQGAVLVTGHFGFFEFGGAIGQALGFPTTVLTLPEHTPALSRWRSAWRRRWGVETVEVGHDAFAYIEILQHLRAGRFIAALGDRPPDKNMIQISLPHGSIPFSTGPATLALMAGCPLIAITVVRKANGRYRLQAHPPLLAADHGATRSEQIENLTREVARALVPTLCEYPEQWYQFVALRSASS